MAVRDVNETRVERPLVRPGVYSRGSATVDAILKAALHVLIEEGAAAFTLRRIAAVCGVQVGNVSRHFPRKEMLVQVLLEEFLAAAEPLVGRNSLLSEMSAQDALAMVIEGTLDEIDTKRTTHLFIELWAMANHNDFVAGRLETLYGRVHKLIGSLVTQLNPSLGPDEVETVSLFINASMEGTTVLAGYGKPWEAKMPQIKALALKSLIHLATTITPEEIRLLPSTK
jgi:AcrR family transcriptional regulator